MCKSPYIEMLYPLRSVNSIIHLRILYLEKIEAYMKKTNKIRSIWIIFKSICVTIWFSFTCMYQARFGTRQQVDQQLRKWSQHLLKIVNLSYRIFDPYHLRLEPNRPYIIMSNHASLYDIPLLFVGLPGSIRMILKKELLQVPIWGHAIKATEFPSIDRNNSTQAMKDLENAKEKMQSGIVLWISPEGTRSRDGKLGQFKKGAFMLALQTGATIIPVGIRGSGKVLPPKTLHFTLGVAAELHIGAPIDATQYTIKTRKELLAVVQKSIQEAAALDLA